MRGQWVLDLAGSLASGTVSLRDGLAFLLARVQAKPLDITLNGLSFQRADHILWALIAEVFLGREYTPPGYEIQPGDIVVDIGAHKGVFVGYAAQFSPAKIIAVEPDPDNFARLGQFIQTNQIENVTAYANAVWKSKGHLPFYRAASSSRNSLLGRDVVSDQPLSSTLQVETITLEELLADIPKVDFLKLDCEGAEFEILQNTPPGVFGRIQKVVMEYHAEADDPVLQKTEERLAAHFSEIKRVARPGMPLGYLYARKNTP